MAQCSQKTRQKLNAHLEKLKSALHNFEQSSEQLQEKPCIQSKILQRNKNLVKTLLIESLFLRLEEKNFTDKKISLIQRILLKNKDKFINKEFYSNSFLFDNKESKIKTLNLRKNLFYRSQKLLTIIIKNLNNGQINFNYFVKNNEQLIKLNKIFFLFIQKFEYYYQFFKNQLLGKWYIYFFRTIIVTLLHFVPFIQLTSLLLYNQPNRQIIHPITSYLLNFAPFLLSIIKRTMTTVNQETFSFLLLVPFMHIFAFKYKKFNLSRKVAYQGTFALALMLYRYGLVINQEALTIIHKYIRRFLLGRKAQNLELLRDDISFYLEDLEDLRDYREEIFHLGESLFSVDDLTKITMLFEPTTLLSLLGVIALLYNYVYFIIRGQKPIIPLVTKTVRRMMVDRDMV